MNIVYAGAPAFSVPPLQALLDAGFAVSAVITQPDKPAGRKGTLTPTPLKAFAEERGIPVHAFAKIRENVAAVRALGADVMVTCAYGQILTQEILSAFPMGVYNIHASLLPRWRGASPVQHAIAAGDERTGITVMRTDVGLDTGDMLLQEGKLPLHKNDLKTVFHNPCELGRGCGVVDAPNHVLEQVSQRIPTRYDGKNSLCCGGSLANTVIDSQQKTKISTDTVKAYSAYQPDVIVTACPLCKKTLGKTSTSVPVKDIAEIVAAS